MQVRSRNVVVDLTRRVVLRQKDRLLRNDYAELKHLWATDPEAIRYDFPYEVRVIESTPHDSTTEMRVVSVEEARLRPGWTESRVLDPTHMAEGTDSDPTN